MNNANEILELALRLPLEDRATLARQLLLSLEPESYETDYEALWAAEIEARMARVEQGQFSAADWREAMDRIRRSLAQEPST